MLLIVIFLIYIYYFPQYFQPKTFFITSDFAKVTPFHKFPNADLFKQIIDFYPLKKCFIISNSLKRTSDLLISKRQSIFCISKNKYFIFPWEKCSKPSIPPILTFSNLKFQDSEHPLHFITPFKAVFSSFSDFFPCQIYWKDDNGDHLADFSGFLRIFDQILQHMIKSSPSLRTSFNCFKTSTIESRDRIKKNNSQEQITKQISIFTHDICNSMFQNIKNYLFNIHSAIFYSDNSTVYPENYSIQFKDDIIATIGELNHDLIKEMKIKVNDLSNGFHLITGLINDCNSLILKMNSLTGLIINFSKENSEIMQEIPIYLTHLFPMYAYNLIHLYQGSHCHESYLRFNRYFDLFGSLKDYFFLDFEDKNLVQCRGNLWNLSDISKEDKNHNYILEDFSKIQINCIDPPSTVINQYFSQMIDEKIPILPLVVQQNNNEWVSLMATHIDNIITILVINVTQLKTQENELEQLHNELAIATKSLGFHKVISSSNGLYLVNNELPSILGYQIENNNSKILDNSNFLNNDENQDENFLIKLVDYVHPDDLKLLARDPLKSVNNLIQLSPNIETSFFTRSSYTINIKRKYIPNQVKKHEYETPVLIPRKGPAITLRLLDSENKPHWYQYLTNGQKGFIYCVDSTIHLKRQLQNTEQSFANFASETQLYFWSIDIKTHRVYPLLSYQFLWDVIGLPNAAKFDELFSYITIGRKKLQTVIELFDQRTITNWAGNLKLLTLHGEKWYKMALSLSGQTINGLMININKQKEMEMSLKRTQELRDMVLSSSRFLLFIFEDTHPVPPDIFSKIPHSFSSDYLHESGKKKIYN